MEVVPYNSALHNYCITSWLAHRNLRTEAAHELPEVGYVAMDKGRPIVAGFIRRVEGGWGMLDSLVTDPLAPAEIRDKAIDILVCRLFKEAKYLKIKQFLAFSRDDNTLVRSLKHGFKKLPDTVIGVDLSQLVIKEFT